jgi:hypothetical protein
MGWNSNRAVFWYLRKRGYKYVIPELSYNGWFGDFIASGLRSGGILEVELKHSWTDYKNDYAKSCDWRSEAMNKIKSKQNDVLYWGRQEVAFVSKYDFLTGDYPALWKPNYFAYAAPGELAQRIKEDRTRPKPFGVLEIKPNGKVISLSPSNRIRKLDPCEANLCRVDSNRRAVNFMDNYYAEIFRKRAQQSNDGFEQEKCTVLGFLRE